MRSGASQASRAFGAEAAGAEPGRAPYGYKLRKPMMPSFQRSPSLCVSLTTSLQRVVMTCLSWSRGSAPSPKASLLFTDAPAPDTYVHQHTGLSHPAPIPVLHIWRVRMEGQTRFVSAGNSV